MGRSCVCGRAPPMSCRQAPNVGQVPRVHQLNPADHAFTDTDVAPAIRGTAAHMEHKFAGARVAAELHDRDSPRTLGARGFFGGALCAREV